MRKTRILDLPQLLDMSPSCVLFSELNLIRPIQDAVAAAGYQKPTPIQEGAIPPALEGRDVLGCAQTGTGKTAAFSLPVLQRIDQSAADDPKIRALILTPTRELAAQIGDNLEAYSKELDLFHTVIFGGVNEKPQIRELKRGVDILVATPGRLIDLLGRGFLSLDDIEVFVLDEADRMLDMGFIHDVRKVIAQLPQKKQTLFFSATMPPEIKKLADTLLTDPALVSVTPVSSTAEKIEQSVCFVDKVNKPKLLVEKLRDDSFERVLVFSRTKHGANKIVKKLDQAKITSAAIHGNKSQGARTRALEGFRKGEISVLVATDIAARGIDVDGVSHVINFDLPNIPETYVHRIGRTARAGREGKSISFCDAEEHGYLRDIERLIKIKITRDEEHSFPAEEQERPPTPRHERQAARRAQGQSRGRRSPRGNGRSHRGGGERTERGPKPSGSARGRATQGAQRSARRGSPAGQGRR